MHALGYVFHTWMYTHTQMYIDAYETYVGIGRDGDSSFLVVRRENPNNPNNLNSQHLNSCT
jgi:hypothetical protein